ncbi:MAG: GAF domain-containing protein [Pseudomonadota bacterium]
MDYALLTAQAEALTSTEDDALANVANVCALVADQVDQLNWVGVYLLRDGELVLGPFIGKTACTRIELGKGVCGTSAANRETLIVANVHEFDGHIACDTASESELVIPLLAGDRLLGVFDIDSPVQGRFDQRDAEGLAPTAALLSAAIANNGRSLGL